MQVSELINTILINTILIYTILIYTNLFPCISYNMSSRGTAREGPSDRQDPHGGYIWYSVAAVH